MAINAGTVAAFLTLDTGQFDGALNQSRMAMQGFTKGSASMTERLKLASEGLTSVGTAATLGLTAPIIAGGAAATKTFSSFDDAIRQVQATMAASAEETERLTAAAKKYGSETRYTAAQAAEALNYLALAGYSADKAISALPKVLQLAQAGGLDLGYASDLVTDSMSALGLEMEQLSAFSDQLARTAQKANTNISQLGYGILTVGGTAKNLAGGTVELNTLLGILADNGIKGAEGGTHLRNVLLSLQTPTDEGAKLLEAYTGGVYDANGELRSLDEILQELNGSLSAMTDQERQNIIGQIFNKTDLAAVEALLAGCGTRYAELSGYIAQSAGAAQQMAQTMEGGIGGSLRSLESAAEGAAIAVGETLAPQIQEGAEWLTEMTNAFNSLDESTRRNIVSTAGMVAAAGPAVVLLGKTVGLVGSIVTHAGAISALMTGPVGWITLGVAGVAALTLALKNCEMSMQDVEDRLSEANADGVDLMRKRMEMMKTEVAVDVDVKKNYAAEASTLYDDIFAWLTDGMPDTEQQKAEVKAKVQGYYDALLADVNLNESKENQRLEKQLANGFITQENYIERTAEVKATADSARTTLGALCDESLAFVENYSGKPAAVVQEAYAEIDTLEARTNALLEQIGLANTALNERGENAVKLTKAGATGDTAVYSLAFEHTQQQFALDKTGLETDLANELAEIETMWRDAYDDALKRGDIDAMDYANARYEEMVDAANAAHADKLKALEEGYLAEFGAMFAGIAEKYPEQFEQLKAAYGKYNPADEALKLLSGGAINPDEFSEELKRAIAGQGINLMELLAVTAGDPQRMQNDLAAALNAVIRDADSFDVATLLSEALTGTDVGMVFAHMLQTGMLDGISAVDMSEVDAQLALLTGHINEYFAGGLEGNGTAWDYLSEIASGLKGNVEELRRSGRSAGVAAREGVSSNLNGDAGEADGKNYGEGLARGMLAKRARVKAAGIQLAVAGMSGTQSTLEIKSPSRVARWMGNMFGDGFAIGVEDRMALVRSTMQRIVDPAQIGTEVPSVTMSASGATTAPEGGSTNFNISVQGARINSAEDARELLLNATKFANRINRGRGRY